MARQELTPPLNEPLDPQQARSRAQQLADTFKQRFWTPVEKQEALTLAEYLDLEERA